MSNFAHEIAALLQHTQNITAEINKQVQENEALRVKTMEKYEVVQRNQEKMQQVVDARSANIQKVNDEIRQQEEAIQAEKAAALKQLEKQKQQLDEAQAQLEAEHEQIKKVSEESMALGLEYQTIQESIAKYTAALSEVKKVGSEVTGNSDMASFLAKYREILAAHKEQFELKQMEQKQAECLINQTASLTAEKASEALILVQMEQKLRKLQEAKKSKQ